MASINVSTPPTIQLTMDGAEVGPIRFLSSYVPVIGDPVWVMVNDSDKTVVGKLADSGDPTTEGIVRRIATAIATNNSAAITTTQTIIHAVTAAVVVGRTYQVTFAGNIANSQLDSTAVVRIREDNETGTVLQLVATFGHTAGGAYPLTFEAEYTADATENKTLVATLVRGSGTGSHNLVAAADRPAYLRVDYIRGGP